MAISRGGKIVPTRWASPVHPELGPGWAIKLLARKKPGQIWPGLIWPGSPEFFLPLKGYLARPTRFLGRAGLLKFWPEKSWPILARPGFGPAHYWPDPARPIASSSYKKQTKRLGEHTNVYLYGEQSEDHHSGLDLMTKQPMFEGFGAESIVEKWEV